VLELRLLGAVSIRLNGKELTPPSSRNARVLLARLALEGPLTRDVLAEGLWPDKPTSSARASLTTELGNLRRALGGAGDRVARYGSSLSLIGQAVWTDVRQFEDAVARADPQEALGLWRGPFMQDTE